MLFDSTRTRSLKFQNFCIFLLRIKRRLIIHYCFTFLHNFFFYYFIFTYFNYFYFIAKNSHLKFHKYSNIKKYFPIERLARATTEWSPPRSTTTYWMNATYVKNIYRKLYSTQLLKRARNKEENKTEKMNIKFPVHYLNATTTTTLISQISYFFLSQILCISSID